MSLQPDDKAPKAPIAAPRGSLRAAIVAALAVVFVAAAIGFVGFLSQLRGAEIRPDRKADGIVVLTGGSSRVSDAMELLAAGYGKRLLISGVHPTNAASDISRSLSENQSLLNCCVDLDRSAVNTRSNAAETRRWARERGFKSLIVVTSNYHMPRAIVELSHAMPDIALVPFAVVGDKWRDEPWWTSGATLRLLLSEYAKYVAAELRVRLADAGLELAPEVTELPSGSLPVFWIVVAIPTFLMPPWAFMAVAKAWARSSIWLMRLVCNTKVEYRGLEKIPKGPLIVASKHQSMWETFALLQFFDAPLFIYKRELAWIPFFGWYLIKSKMIGVDRSGGMRSLMDMARRAPKEIRSGRQLIIFPEGTRTPVGAPPDYMTGVGQIYAKSGVPCIPVALNSGLFWPRRTFMRYPGTLVVEFLDPLPPGLSRKDFTVRIRESIEAATKRLVDAARQEQAQLFGRVPSSASANG
jgi:1-acyl-sn-glycerol-3-phosphate acyltransferase